MGTLISVIGIYLYLYFLTSPNITFNAQVRNELKLRQRHEIESKTSSDVVERRELLIKDWSR